MTKDSLHNKDEYLQSYPKGWKKKKKRKKEKTTTRKKNKDKERER